MVVIGLNCIEILSDKLVTCFGVVKRRSCHYFSALQPRTHAVLPRLVGISNEFSRTLEVYRKVLHVLDCISEGPLWTVVH